MTTTPLPPPELIFFDAALQSPLEGYTVSQMQAYATQARADLEAENQRLEKFVHLVLDGCLRCRIKSPPIVIEDLEATDLKLISLADAARAALKDTK